MMDDGWTRVHHPSSILLSWGMLRPLLVFLIATSAPVSAQSPLAEAEAAWRAGQAWRTTQLLGPLLEAPATRTPDAVILAAQAAAAWQGWGTVGMLLQREPWLDSRYDGLGRRLLAEAALGDGRARDAVQHATLAVANNSDARTAAEQGRRLLLLARAYDRLDQFDSAATNYRLAGRRFPLLRDWFALRAAGVESDSTERTVAYRSLTLPAALPGWLAPRRWLASAPATPSAPSWPTNGSARGSRHSGCAGIVRRTRSAAPRSPTSSSRC